MNTQELDSLKMKTMKEVADAQVLLSGMKAEMEKLKSEKNDFFKQREDELLQRLLTFAEHSSHLLRDIETNYTLVHQFYETLKTFSDYLKDGQAEFKEVVMDFKERMDEFEIYLGRNIELISEQRKRLKLREEGLNKDREFLRGERKWIEQEKTKIASQQAQIRSALKLLSKRQ